MKRMWLPLVGRCLAVLIAGNLVLSQPSIAQETPVDNLGDASREIPAEALAPQQYKAGATVFITQQERVVNEVFALEEALYKKVDSLLIGLGEQRIRDYQAALNLPERTAMQRLLKRQVLAEFKDVDPARIQAADEADLTELGSKVFERRVRKSERLEDFEVVIEGVGRAEPKNIDGNICVKVVHYETGAAFLIGDQNLNTESAHFKQYVARANLLANRGQGRPLVLLIRQMMSVEGAPEAGSVRYQYFPKPVSRSERAKAWWRANYVAPDRGAAMLTAMSVLFQVGFAEGVEGLRTLMDASHVWSHNSAMLNVAFGSIFGLWSSFYSNITAAKDPNDPTSRWKATTLRMLISSATFAYTLHVMNFGVASLTLSTNAGWLNHGRLWLNNIVNNAVKDQFKKINDQREDMGLSRGTVKVLSVEMKRNQFERQIMYQPPNFLKLLDLTKLEAAGVPVGSLVFYSSYVWMQYLNFRYAMKMNYSKKDLIAAQWNRLVRTPVRLVQNAASSVNAIVRTRGQVLIDQFWAIGGRCTNFFKRQPRDYSADTNLRELGFRQTPEGLTELEF